MKYVMLLVTVFALNSCNTTIGIYRDSKQAFMWTKEKIQGMQDGGGGSGGADEEYGAPVY